jgi:hypothetical protein
VRRNVDGSGASLAGVSTCGSVWACPVCSLKVCMQRQGEVADGMKAHVGNGGYVWLMTNTFPHEAGERPLAEMLELQAKAMQKFQNCRTYKRILGKGVRAGSIKALEITLGTHGWHPHTHSLVFATPDAFGDVREGDDGRMASRLIDELKAAWYAALLKVGLCTPAQMSDVLDHGLDVRGGQYAAEYVAKFGRDTKWGLSRELTMNAAKTGGGLKGAHPFQLLEWAAKGDGQAAAQFREYVAAFTGRRMLTWTPGLKAALGLHEREESTKSWPPRRCRKRRWSARSRPKIFGSHRAEHARPLPRVRVGVLLRPVDGAGRHRLHRVRARHDARRAARSARRTGARAPASSTTRRKEAHGHA